MTRSVREEQTRSLVAADAGALHDKLLADTRELMGAVGDASNLILDPDLSSYYLMDGALLKLPEGADLLMQARILGRGVTQRRAVTPAERAEATRLAPEMARPRRRPPLTEG